MRRRVAIAVPLATCLMAYGEDSAPKGQGKTAPVVATAAPSAPAPSSLSLTRDERAMLLGYAGRAEAIQLKAQRELDAISMEQAEYLKGVAMRLRIPPERLREYSIDLASGAVALKPKTEAKGKP